MERKGEWHSAWGSAVQHRRCERGHNQGSKSLQGAHPFSLDLCRHPPTLRMHTNLLARGRALPSYTAHCLVTTNAKKKKKKKKKIVLKGLVSDYQSKQASVKLQVTSRQRSFKSDGPLGRTEQHGLGFWRTGEFAGNAQLRRWWMGRSGQRHG